MSKRTFAFCAASLIAAFAHPALAEVMRSNVAFNSGIGEQTGDQPANGMTVAYQVTLAGGALDGCTVDIVESLHPRDEGAWGLFDIAGDVTCGNGGFSYTSSGAWDGNGFHGAGAIQDGSGTGEMEGITGRIAQLGGTASSVDGGTMDVAYELVVDANE